MHTVMGADCNLTLITVKNLLTPILWANTELIASKGARGDCLTCLMSPCCSHPAPTVPVHSLHPDGAAAQRH